MRSLTRSESIGVIALLSIITALVGWVSLRSPSMHVTPGIVIRPSRNASSLPTLPAAAMPNGLTETPPSEIVVHVAGAVHKPGVYHLKPGARNDDAITAAGGALTTANTDAVNLAAHIEDGAQLYLPTHAEQAEGGAATSPQNAATKSVSHSSGVKSSGHSRGSAGNKPAKLMSASQGQVNLNTAGAEELQRLPGIGPSMAERIITYRKENGGFKNAEDLMQVSGIGEKRFEKMRPLVRLK